MTLPRLVARWAWRLLIDRLLPVATEAGAWALAILFFLILFAALARNS